MKRNEIGLVLVVFALLSGSGHGAEQDAAAIRACEMVKPEEAESIIGGKLLTPPIAGHPHCRYTVEMPDGSTEAYQVSFVPASVEEPYFDLRVREGPMEKVAGLWDEALLGPQEFGAGFKLLILKRGQLAVEISGDRKEPLLALARLIVERVNLSADP